MGWKAVLTFILVLLAIALLVLYWFFPFSTNIFEPVGPGHSNFSLNGFDTTEMQFYENMRYPSKTISYKIDDCTLQKEDNMERAFEILELETALQFYPVDGGEEISVTCDSRNKIEGGMFIAGEGGPANITRTDKFSVIFNGKILLIKKSKCENPNVALHELLHALGFMHSSNPDNIMYNVSKCDQTIGEDIPLVIDKLYSYPTYSDLSFEETSATMHGRYLDINISVRNNGLKKSGEAKIIVSADGDEIKEFDLSPVDIGYGRTITLTNVFIKKLSVDELEFFIDSNFQELEKENNKIILKIKEKN